jgi:hypothetical protein
MGFISAVYIPNAVFRAEVLPHSPSMAHFSGMILLYKFFISAQFAATKRMGA